MQLFLESGIFGGLSAFRIHLWPLLLRLTAKTYDSAKVLCYGFSVRQVVSRYITNYIVPTLKDLLIHAKSSLCYVFPIAKSPFLPLCYVMGKKYPDRNSSKHSWIQKWSKNRIKNVSNNTITQALKVILFAEDCCNPLDRTIQLQLELYAPLGFFFITLFLLNVFCCNPNSVL